MGWCCSSSIYCYASTTLDFRRTRPSVQGLRRRGRGDHRRAAGQRDRSPTVGRRPVFDRDHRQSRRTRGRWDVGLCRDDRRGRGLCADRAIVPKSQRCRVHAVLERHDRAIQRRRLVAPQHPGQHGTNGPSRDQSHRRHDR